MTIPRAGGALVVLAAGLLVSITPASAATPTIVTQASPSVPVGGQIFDTATLSGGFNPTGTITFQLFGPDNATCAGPPLFTSTVPVNGNGSYQSAPFTATSPGTYRWIAAYSGDANNAPASGACGDPNEQTIVEANPPPTINVDKTADPPSRPEPGGVFTYTVVVTNTSNEPVTITSLNDSVYGDLNTRPGSTCGALIGTTLAPGASSAPCTFSGPFFGNAGDSLTDVVTATAVDDDGQTATDADDAVVTITNVPPTISVDKTADPPSRPAPGGDFTFTVVVTNTSNEPVTITSLTDSVYGDLNNRGTCTTAVGTVLASSPGPGNTYTCSFTGPFTAPAGSSQTDVVTAAAIDDDNSTVTGSDDATVTITAAEAPPAIRVDKSADPHSRPEPGGDFTYRVVFSNVSSAETVTITSITDSVYGDLNTRPGSNCAGLVGATYDPRHGFLCSFTAPFTGNAGASLTNVVTVTARDDDGQTATASDDATVTITPGAPPTITATKSAVPSTRPLPDGHFVYRFIVTNNGPRPVTVVELTDSVRGNLNGHGTCDTGAVLAPGASYSCAVVVYLASNTPISETGTFTARVVDAQGRQAVASDAETIALIADPDSGFRGGLGDGAGIVQPTTCTSQFRSGITDHLASGRRFSRNTLQRLIRQYKSCLRAGGR